jgi:hypothetical protein
MARSTTLENGITITAGVGPVGSDNRRRYFIEVCFSDDDPRVYRKSFLELHERDSEWSYLKFALKPEDPTNRPATVHWLEGRSFYLNSRG